MNRKGRDLVRAIGVLGRLRAEREALEREAEEQPYGASVGKPEGTPEGKPDGAVPEPMADTQFRRISRQKVKRRLW